MIAAPAREGPTTPIHELKAAFICPWYGPDIPGGAEAEARRTVENLRQRGLWVEVWTTCIRDFEGDWGRNEHREGPTEINGITVKRFPVGPRNGQLFAALNRRVLNREKLSPAEENLFFQHMINAPELYRHIRREGSGYILFFIPYLFSTTFYGAAIYPDRSFVIPCLHDEGYAYLDSLGRVLHRVRGMIFHTRSEMELGRRLFGLSEEQTLLFGEGIDTEIESRPERFRRRFHLADPFVLYAGRRDRGKNTPLLMRYFSLYKQRRPSNLRLLLIGNLPVSIPSDQKGHILDFGFLSRQDKYDAYGAADLFCQPSVMESFSIVIMEAWLCGTPVLVNGHCPATVEHCRESQGGLFFTDYWEFEEAVDALRSRPDLSKKLAENGRRYVLSRFHWDEICRRYLDLMEEAWGRLAPASHPTAKEKPMKKPALSHPWAVHQMLPDFSYGDAIGNDVLAIRQTLRDWGFASEIYAQHVHPRLTNQSRPFQDYLKVSRPENVLIFHFSIGSELSEFVKRLPDRKILVYHNITPPHFFRGINPEVERRCAWGLEELKRLAPSFELGLGVSDFNRIDLERAGFRKTGVLPIFLDFKRYRVQSEAQLERRLTDGRWNILHVGRLVPQKKIEDLVRVFYLFQKRLYPESRLLLVGSESGVRNYTRAIRQLIADLGLTDKVWLPGFTSFRELVTYYRASHLYLCLSEHEGFCVPLVESMFFGLPIIAYLAGGIPETLGGSGLGLQQKDFEAIAELMGLVLEDPALRAQVIAGQRERLQAFSLEKTRARFREHLAPFWENL